MTVLYGQTWWVPYVEVTPLLLEGLWVTFQIIIIGLFFGFIIGAIFGLARLSKNKIVYGIATVYVEIIRGTPILVQILFIYFGMSDLFGINLPRFTAAVIAIAVNSGSYIAEVVRGAVYSIDKGQMEAGRTIGLSHAQTMRYIIWPQAVKRMIPPLGNQFIISIKDTSLFSVIAVAEIVYQGQQYAALTFNAFETYTMVGITYLILTIPLSYILGRIEKRLDVS